MGGVGKEAGSPVPAPERPQPSRVLSGQRGPPRSPCCRAAVGTRCAFCYHSNAQETLFHSVFNSSILRKGCNRLRNEGPPVLSGDFSLEKQLIDSACRGLSLPATKGSHPAGL